ncbi:hypothetical protein H8S20_07185 [Clostridium sp. NSJ-6]|uniref:M protein trans-acting positive regulator (MGA) HTH domain-containing protein n=1 Tax=Clostridium hominis TaxID=2763036 RepID=A0ABR7DC18_9CLOT|nr:hypothetical protein [Clostridium hominis]MBC5628670.1 hypothetical protein [Clostridium hominis]
MIIILEREKLYEEVWTVRMKELANKYGISEATLRKHCRALKVPIPQSGYWIKVNNGSNPKRIPIPNFSGDNVITIQKNELVKKISYKSDNRLKHMSDEEKNRVLSICGMIKVTDKLNKQHYLIQECSFYRDNRDMIRDGIASNINIKVSKENEKRALRIFNVILKTFENLGYNIRSERRETRIYIGKEEIRIGLKEKLKRVPHIKTEKDSHWSPTYDYEYSGELSIFIDEYKSPKKNWRDLDNKKVEEMIGDFIVAVIDAAEILREFKEQREIEEKEEREKKINKMKIKKRQEYEIKKFEELKEIAENYRVAKLIDEYIGALEEVATEINKEDEKYKILEYIEWARKKSAWLNPIKQGEDEIIGNKYNDIIYELNFNDEDNYWWVN